MSLTTFPTPQWVVGLTFIVPLALAAAPASAQGPCGEPSRDVPTYVQEQLSGDAEGKAQALTKLLGGVEVKGKVDAGRTELYQQHRNLDQHQIDMYFMWVACQAIAADSKLATAEKLTMWTQIRSAFDPLVEHNPSPTRNPNALYQYGEAVADVQGAVISQANGTISFQFVHTSGKADPTRDVEYQDWVLSCPALPAPRPNVFVGTFSGVVAGEICRIIRKASTS